MGRMPSVEMLLAFAGTSLLIAGVPGPSVAYVVARSAQHGTAAGLFSMMGLGTGVVVHTGMAAAGVAALIALVPMGLEIVGWIGAGYLAWLAVHTLRARSAEQHDDGTIAVPQRGRLFLDGLLVDVLNPKTALFFIAFLPQFVRPERGPSALQLGVLGLLYMLIAVTCYSTYAVLAGRLTVRLRGSGSIRSRMAFVTAGIYLVLAVVVLVV
ncbi:LysE family translocator [Microbacterium bovistercoris]|uniref:LysE family translocator n=2 Tax=Microbacterium bovistercoris TaxID=2293570 RepID=A0A371NYV9_9MICO|nr:LysE family translocator [Microbacterium bovistercoris]